MYNLKVCVMWIQTSHSLCYVDVFILAIMNKAKRLKRDLIVSLKVIDFPFL